MFNFLQNFKKMVMKNWKT